MSTHQICRHSPYLCSHGCDEVSSSCSSRLPAVISRPRHNASDRRMLGTSPPHVPQCKILPSAINPAPLPRRYRVPGEAGSQCCQSPQRRHAKVTTTDQRSQVNITEVTSASRSWHPSRNPRHCPPQKKKKKKVFASCEPLRSRHKRG